MVSSFYFQVLYSYGIGFVYILIGLVFSGGLAPAFKFCAQVKIHKMYRLICVCFSRKFVISSTYIIIFKDWH